MTITELISAHPILSLMFISLAVTFVSSLAQKWLTNQEHLKSLKKRQKEIQQELKGCKDECRLKELNAEVVSITGVMMKSSMRPLLVTFIPFLILYGFLRGIYSPLLGKLGWILYYLLFSLVSSVIIRKILDIA